MKITQGDCRRTHFKISDSDKEEVGVKLIHIETGVTITCTQSDTHRHINGILATDLIRAAVMRHKGYSEEDIEASYQYLMKCND